MQELYGQCRGAIVLLHGGAGSQDPGRDGLRAATADLEAIASTALASLTAKKPGLDVVVDCLKALELNERFNAGYGAALQADAQARLTAALMAGPTASFSGVIAATYVTHPSLLARHLQEEESRVLTTPGTELLARRLGLKVESNITPSRLRRWHERAAKGERFCDTVGCLVRTVDGELFAGTSTGGRGFEFPGRVSDSGTVAGTYCSRFAAVSATGVGEQIVDDALAARLETRRRDGMTLAAASQKCFQEAQKSAREYGWIAVDAEGFWGAAHTTPSMSFVIVNDEGMQSSSK